MLWHGSKQLVLSYVAHILCTCRQIIHDESQVGLEKAVSAVNKMSRINSSVTFNSLICKLTSENAMSIIEKYDLVVDATDNIDARYTINDCCVLLRKPFVSGSAVQMDGQITTVIPYVTPCYRCLYPSLSVTLGSCRSCADAGVLGPIPGLIGCLEAIEVIKLLLNRDKYVDAHKEVTPQKDGGGVNGSSANSTDQSSHTAPAPKKQRVNGKSASQLKPLLGRQVMFDAVTGEFHTFQLPPRSSHCAVCGDHPTVTNMAESRATLESVPAPVCAPVPAGPEDKNKTVLGKSGSTWQDNTIDHTKEGTEEWAEHLPGAPSVLPAVSSYVVALREENKITCKTLASALGITIEPTDQTSKKSYTRAEIHLIVDVRSAEQFSIARLNLPQVLSFASLEESAVLETCTAARRAEMLKGVKAVQVNVPLSVLKGGRVASTRETNQQQVLADLHRLRALLDLGHHHNSKTSGEKANTDPTIGVATAHTTDMKAAASHEAKAGMFVLCRRGIDSVTATQLLLSLGTEPRVCNVEGGLTAWSKEVDTTFLMY